MCEIVSDMDIKNNFNMGINWKHCYNINCCNIKIPYISKYFYHTLFVEISFIQVDLENYFPAVLIT